MPGSPTEVEIGEPGRSTLDITAGPSFHRIVTTLTGHHLWPPRP